MSSREVGQDHSIVENSEQHIIDVAELWERRVLTERNTNKPTCGQTQCWSTAMLGFARVREKAKSDKVLQFTALLHHVTPELLSQSFYQLKRQAAKGVDGVSWQDYYENLDKKLRDLHARIQSGRYIPQPSRRVLLPKEDGTQRPLSIQSTEDKIVQQAMVSLLNQIYEADFMGFSYGFRPGRSQHDALDALTFGISKRKVNWVLDLDLQKFFDTVEHNWLIQMLQHRVQDKRIIKLITKWIKVGVVDESGQRIPARCGVPQGAVISPLLANIYLHYVFDLWSHRWRQKKAQGEVLITRYADDVIVCFQSKWDANEYQMLLKRRLSKFGLTMHPDKTRLIRFGRYAAGQCVKPKEKRPETFDFLGFTHYCTTRKNGEFKVGRKTIRKRLLKQIKAVQQELRKRMHRPIGETLKWLRAVLTGHLNYYSVPGNSQQVSLFFYEVTKRWFKMLRRRSQRYRIVWEKFGPWLRRHLPKVRVVHAYPEMRFRAKYSK